MLEIKEDLVFLAHVISPIVDRRAVRSRRLHHIDHHSWDIDFVSSTGVTPSQLFCCLCFCGLEWSPHSPSSQRKR